LSWYGADNGTGKNTSEKNHYYVIVWKSPLNVRVLWDMGLLLHSDPLTDHFTALFTKVINASHQTSLESPLKEFI